MKERKKKKDKKNVDKQRFNYKREKLTLKVNEYQI